MKQEDVQRTVSAASIEAKLGLEGYDTRTSDQRTKISNSSETSTGVESPYRSTEAEDLARTDPDFLAGLAMPLTFLYLWPSVLRAVWEWLTTYVQKSRDFSQLLLGLPRGFGKTTLIKIFILYCILFTKRKFILVINAREDLAINTVSDVCRMLDEPNMVRLFGDWKIGVEKNTATIKIFGFRGRSIILWAAGVDTGIRGINVVNERPDVMIFDDIQSRKDADSKVVSEALEVNIIGTAMKAKSPHGCLFVFIGNMYPTPHSILRKLKGNPNWVKFIAGGILADGTSLWEELQPIKQLLAEYRNDASMGHGEIFRAEVLNDENAAVNTSIDLNLVPPYKYDDTEPATHKFVIVDPSSDKANADLVTIGLVEVYDTKPVLRKVLEDKLSPGEIVKESIRMCVEQQCRVVVFEAQGAQYQYLYWFKKTCEELGIYGLEALEVYSGQMSKNGRIINMLKMYIKGEIWCHPDCKIQAHDQIKNFNPAKRDNNDGILDVMTYAPKVLEEYGDYIQSVTNVFEMQEFETTKVWDSNTSF
jgi:hypothetical protein